MLIKFIECEIHRLLKYTYYLVQNIGKAYLLIYICKYAIKRYDLLSLIIIFVDLLI